METLFWIGLENAAAALVLALPVALLGLFLRRPALLHALWVIVLLKLVTPPVIRIPVGFSTLGRDAAPAPLESPVIAGGAAVAGPPPAAPGAAEMAGPGSRVMPPAAPAARFAAG